LLPVACLPVAFFLYFLLFFFIFAVLNGSLNKLI
jgi:hypothetical protein